MKGYWRITAAPGWKDASYLIHRGDGSWGNLMEAVQSADQLRIAELQHQRQFGRPDISSLSGPYQFEWIVK